MMSLEKEYNLIGFSNIPKFSQVTEYNDDEMANSTH
jgi:hypothetical protein